MNESDRRFEPTARRQRRARREGDLVISRELGALLSLAGAAGAVILLAPAWLGALQQFARSQWSPASPEAPLWSAELHRAAGLSAALLLAVLAAACLATAIQTRWRATPLQLRPNWERLNAGSNLKRLATKATLADAAIGIVKAALVLGVICGAVWRHFGLLAGFSDGEWSELWRRSLLLGRECGWELAGILLACALSDYGLQWWRRRRRLMMSLQELREEARDTEGSPETRRERRRRRDAQHDLSRPSPRSPRSPGDPASQALRL